MTNQELHQYIIDRPGINAVDLYPLFRISPKGVQKKLSAMAEKGLIFSFYKPGIESKYYDMAYAIAEGIDKQKEAYDKEIASRAMNVIKRDKNTSREPGELEAKNAIHRLDSLMRPRV